MALPPPVFTLPRVLVCEGNEDKAFFERLINTRNLPRFHIRTTAPSRTEVGGNTRFVTALRQIKVTRQYGLLKNILLVTEADDNATARFRWICDQISAAGVGPPPSSILTPSKSIPAIIVMTIPLDAKSGCLETICELPARRADVQIAATVDNFVAMSGKNRWPLRHQTKVWLRANLTVRADDPFVFLGSVFREEKNKHLIPLDDPSLDGIAKVLEGIGRLGDVQGDKPSLSAPDAQTKPPRRRKSPHTRNPRKRV